MSDHDFDTNGPSDEELRDLLRSMPRKQAPESFEPELMRRVDGLRRGRWLFGVLHTAARPDWIGGFASAAAAALVVAGAWLYSHEGRSPIVHPVAPAPAALSTPPRTHSVTPPAQRLEATPQVAARQEIEPPVGTPRKPVSARRPAPSRRRAPGIHATVAPAHPAAIDTVTAARIDRSARPTTLPSSSEAGIRPQSDPATPAPLPTLHGEPTGVDTGARRR
jgi:hypothetical protein